MGIQGEEYEGLHMQTVKEAIENDTSLVEKKIVGKKKKKKEKVIRHVQMKKKTRISKLEEQKKIHKYKYKY